MKLTKRKMYKKMRKILRYVEAGGEPNIKDSADSDIWGGVCYPWFFERAS